ncbi:MAG: NADH-quinone oxidoreductase subunit J [Verrucomicrobiota bacterium]|jgi:NADH-quinone oxidoreductase subunit J
MNEAFVIVSIVLVAGAIGAMTLRNLVHCALAAAVAFGSLAALFLLLGAQFIGLAQLLVYVGAVAILIVFAILLTRGSEPSTPPAQPLFSSSWIIGVAVAFLVFGTLALSLFNSKAFQSGATPAPAAPVKAIGQQLMTNYVVALEVIALLLTAAMIGAVIIAMRDKNPPTQK